MSILTPQMTGRERIKMRILRQSAFERQGGACHWCRHQMLLGKEFDAHARQATADHVIRRADGGKTTKANIVAACRKCNNERHGDDERELNKAPRTYGDDRPLSPFEILF